MCSGVTVSCYPDVVSIKNIKWDKLQKPPIMTEHIEPDMIALMRLLWYLSGEQMADRQKDPC